MKNQRAIGHLAFIAGAATLVYWVYMRTLPAIVPFPQTPADPIDMAFANNPSAWVPPNLGDSTINININQNPYMGLSNQYIPMFGFVGMAQGEMYGGGTVYGVGGA